MAWKTESSFASDTKATPCHRQQENNKHSQSVLKLFVCNCMSIRSKSGSGIPLPSRKRKGKAPGKNIWKRQEMKRKQNHWLTSCQPKLISWWEGRERYGGEGRNSMAWMSVQMPLFIFSPHLFLNTPLHVTSKGPPHGIWYATTSFCNATTCRYSISSSMAYGSH